MNTTFVNTVILKSAIIHFYRYRSVSTVRVPFVKSHTWPKRIVLNTKFVSSGFMNAVSWSNHYISIVPIIS